MDNVILLEVISVITLLIVSPHVTLSENRAWSITPPSLCDNTTLCMTLSEFVSNTSQYITDNMTLNFLPGNHHLDFELKIENISFLKISSSNGISSVSCGSAIIAIVNVTLVSLENVHFMACAGNVIRYVNMIKVVNCHFQGPMNQSLLAISHGGVFKVSRSTITVYNCSFVNNRVLYTGGAISILYGTLQLNHTSFLNNSAELLDSNKGRSSGGAIHAARCNLTVHNSNFTNNRGGKGGAIFSRGAGNNLIVIESSTFHNNTAVYYASSSTSYGGAICNFYRGALIVNLSRFFYNTAEMNGGAIHTEDDITVLNSLFTGNVAEKDNGGAIVTYDSIVTVRDSLFNSNSAKNGQGGALYLNYIDTYFSYQPNIIIETTNFTNNIALQNGGGLTIFLYSNVTIHNCDFINNTAKLGCGLYITTLLNEHISGFLPLPPPWSQVTIQYCRFISNTVIEDGVIYMYGDANRYFTLVSTFITNTTVKDNSTHSTTSTRRFLEFDNARVGYGVVTVFRSELAISGITIISNNCGSLMATSSNVTISGESEFLNNSVEHCKSPKKQFKLQQGGAVTAYQSKLIFERRSTFTSNQAENGGAILAVESELHMNGKLYMSHNIASMSGAALYVYQTVVSFAGVYYSFIDNNIAENEGGGIHAISSTIRMLKGGLHLILNKARRGGGMFLESNSKLHIIKSSFESNIYKHSYWIALKFIENSAEYGGAIYVTDNTNSGTCASIPTSTQLTAANECFYQSVTFYQLGEYDTLLHEEAQSFNVRNIYFSANNATIAGHSLYGGLLDRCRASPLAEMFKISNNTDMDTSALEYVYYTTDIQEQDIESDPVRVCFCDGHQPNCSHQPDNVKVKKGARFTLSVVAVDQVGRSVPSTIHSSLKSPGGTFNEGQLLQTASENCTELEYNILSPHDSEQLLLYAEGPCRDIEISQQRVNVTFLPCTCPAGFQQLNIETTCDCICDPVLKPHITNCSLELEVVYREGNFWIMHLNETSLDKQGYVIVQNCPYDYCYPSTDKVYINFNLPTGSDAQCAYNRSGTLCGSCQEGLSLSLGSSHCMPCSNYWLALLIPFSIAGIVLTLFLLICNVTVAVGTINGLIFYANIIIANRATFLPFQTPTVFIAWINLDFGFETCFYDGMDGYAKVWLQLVFPLYVIFLVAMVIVVCEHSRRFSRLLSNRNPVATLATLILLSYAKLLRTIIAALSFTTLEYPDGSHETVWLYDANIPYLGRKHIPLFLVALFILLLGTAYTLLLFFWQWLFQFSNVKILRWIGNTRLYSFMDAYHAPYNTKHRYWTGLLLLVCVVLYVISSLDHIICDARIDLLSITCALIGLLLVKTNARIYKNWLLNALDNSFLLNLLVFAVATNFVRETNGNQAAIAYTSTSIAFVTFLVILVYHTLRYVLKKTFLTEMYDKYQQGEDITSILSFRSKKESITPTHISYPLVYQVPNGDDTDGLPIITEIEVNDNEIELHQISDNDQQEKQNLMSTV